MISEKVRAVLYDDEIMQGMFKAGFITANVFFHRDIYLWVTTQVTVRGITQNKAMNEAVEKFDVSKRTIERAVYTFKK